MDYKLFKKGTILIRSGPSFEPNKKHLFVICNDTCDQGMNLLVPIASWINSLCDDTCRLSAGEHPFINRPSYILYRKTRLEAADYLLNGINNGTIIRYSDFNLHHFLRIKAGIVKSKHTPRKFKKYAGDVMGLKYP